MQHLKHLTVGMWHISCVTPSWRGKNLQNEMFKLNIPNLEECRSRVDGYQ